MTLQIKNLFFRYRTHEVLKDISLTLTPGKFTGLLGPNASGKTTLMKNAAGLLTPDKGDIEIDQERLCHESAKSRAQKIAYVPQEDDVFLPFTVEQIVAMGRAPHLGFLGFERPEDHEIITRSMHLTDTLSLRNRSFLDLSGGERRRVVIARALAQEAPILLMDEPTSHLDIHHQIALLELSFRMTRERQLITFVSLHDINLAALYCDRLILLSEGKLVAEGAPEDIITEENLAKVFRTPTIIHRSESSRPWFEPKRHQT